MSQPSPVSDESTTTTEGTVLREFVDQAIAQKRLATMSPRSALLSQSSLQTPTADERSSEIANGAVDSGRQVRKRSPSSRRKRGLEVAKPGALAQLMDVDLSRKDPKDEVVRLRGILKTVERHSVMEAARAKELERRNEEAERRMQLLAETQLREKQEALKAQQEVRLVQLQLQNAQEEIERKQREIRRAERQRDDAEAEAARARDRARKFHEQTVAAAAREEGRRLGFQAGLDYASQERMIAAKKKSANPPPRRSRRADTLESQSTARNHKGKERTSHQSESFTNGRSHRPSHSEHHSEHRSEHRSAHRSEHRSHRSEDVPPPTMPAVSEYFVPNHSEPEDHNPNPDSELSPSQLPLRTLPRLFDTYSVNGGSTRNGPPHTTPPGQFAPPPESEVEAGELRHNRFSGAQGGDQTRTPAVPIYEVDIPPASQLNYPPQAHNLAAGNRQPPQIRTPLIEVYEIEMPPADQLNREYSTSQENSNEAVRQEPREKWLTASSYHERKGSRTRNAPPAPDLPPPQPQPARPIATPQQPPNRSVKFSNILSRPSLSKTKEQASSWYRSLSFRKKSKPMIDPIPEDGTNPISAGPATGSTFDESQPPTATEPDTADSEMYAGRAPSQKSWYQPNQPPLIPPSAPTTSMRSGYSRMRPISDAASVSTRVSQFELVATPHAPPPMSVRSGKGKLKEKDSYLSAITEDPASRGNTPASGAGRAPRTSEENIRSMASVLSQPNYAPRPLQQQSSYGTFDSLAAQNNRRSRRVPPSIAVPDHDQELEPYGVAYNRGAVANGLQTYAGADLNRRPSRISEKTTPNSSIGIDVVPPSGFAPDTHQSPPHTGRNHLSPYHTYHAAAPLFQQSVESFRHRSPAPERPPSAAASRKKSKQSFGAYEPPRGQYQPSPGPSNAPPRPMSASSRPASAMQNHTYATDTGYPSSQRVRPESVRSAARGAPPYASQTSLLSNLTGTGGVFGQPPNANGSRLMLASPIHRVASNASMRSQSSYARYDPSSYVDPAFWDKDGPPAPPPAAREPEGYFDGAMPPRAPSANSGLSYA